MTEAVLVAICVGGVALISQIITSWLQPKFKSAIERKTLRQKEIRSCFSTLFGLIGTKASLFDAYDYSRDEYVGAAVTLRALSDWRVRFNSIVWEVKTYIYKDNKELSKALDALAKNIAYTCDIENDALFMASIITCGDGFEFNRAAEKVNASMAGYSELYEKFQRLSIEYVNKL
ncbi:MAG: hypothetical protein FWD30_03690 [Dehalococcoidia bacterium]|nr:hypothetical protein [Dehalococcoidia bacterium]